ncbi:MAG: PAS domain S-box protein, partial [Candidatus Methanosuratus sp.]|nr:PAS domain S-box protein [Candidatus Methanosuratincola sp.]
ERSEARYHVLFEASPVGIFLETLDGEILECNAAAGEMLGYTPDEMVGMNARELVSEDISTRMDDFIAQEVEHGGAFTETRVKRKDGRGFLAEVSTTLISLNGRTLAIAYMLDISGRKAAEEALRAHEELLRAMFESVSECILVWDKDLICLQANRAAVDYLGIPHEKLVGKSLEEGLHRLPHFVERWKTHIEKVLEER